MRRNAVDQRAEELFMACRRSQKRSGDSKSHLTMVQLNFCNTNRWFADFVLILLRIVKAAVSLAVRRGSRDIRGCA